MSLLKWITGKASMAKCSADDERNRYLQALRPPLSTSILYKHSRLLSAAFSLISLRLPFKSNFLTHVLLP